MTDAVPAEVRLSDGLERAAPTRAESAELLLQLVADTPRCMALLEALDKAAKEWLADEGYDPVFGARPLKRVIQRHLQDQLAQMLLGGEILDGSTVKARSTDGKEGGVLNLDIDPSTHPAWTGGGHAMLDRGGRVSRFNNKFGGFVRK